VRSDPPVEERALLGLVRDWRTFLADGVDEIVSRRLEKHLRTGRPCGPGEFVDSLEKMTGRELGPRKRGWPKGRPRKLGGRPRKPRKS
jgi:hypothetical protein